MSGDDDGCTQTLAPQWAKLAHQGDCFNNAAGIALRDPKATYVEDVAWSMGCGFRHARVTLDGVHAIGQTWPTLGEATGASHIAPRILRLDPHKVRRGRVVILYHFTRPEFLPAIREQGIVPRAVPHTLDGDDPRSSPAAFCMTQGEPVVWLTTNADEWIGVRLDLRLEPNSTRLKQWAPWAPRHGMLYLDRIALDAAMREGKDPNDIEQCFVHFGTIPPTLIIAGLERTAA
jgi:hypothetical protein